MTEKVKEKVKEKGKKKAEKAPAAEPKPAAPRTPARLRERYRQQMVPALMKRFGYRNVLQVPRLEKVVINMGLGEAVANVKIIDNAVEELAAISGQRPIITRAKKSEASFKLRAGMPIGCKVTLRGTGCTSSWTDFSISPSRGSGTFEGSLRIPSMVAGIMRSGSRSSSSFPR